MKYNYPPYFASAATMLSFEPSTRPPEKRPGLLQRVLQGIKRSRAEARRAKDQARRRTKSKGLVVEQCSLPAPYHKDSEWEESFIPKTEFLCEWEQFGLLKIFYWYACGDYCGAGRALVETVDGWFLVDMGHCSCNGPLEDWYPNPEHGVDTVDELFTSCSDDEKRYVHELYYAALEADNDD